MMELQQRVVHLAMYRALMKFRQKKKAMVMQQHAQQQSHTLAATGNDNDTWSSYHSGGWGGQQRFVSQAQHDA
jgi:hypothetical protein